MIFAALSVCSFFSKHPATTEIYTLSLHDALPISEFASRPGLAARGDSRPQQPRRAGDPDVGTGVRQPESPRDRKSTRLNSSHPSISYAVFCLKKKNTKNTYTLYRLMPPHPSTLPL